MDAFLTAIAYLGTLEYWQVLIAGTLLAIVHGLLPGIGSLHVMAILLPFIIFNIQDPAVALVLLAAITGTGNTLDSLPAVVVGLPASATQVTFLEGHQLARRGQAAYAMGAVYAVSGLGGLVGAAALAAVIPVIKPLILTIDRSEIAIVAMFGIAMVAVLSRGAMIKGLAAACLGVLIATVGVDPFTGARRFTFGQIELWEGLPLVAVVTGIFAIPEMIDLTMTRSPVAAVGARLSRAEMLRGALYGLKRWKETIRQSLFGVFLGAIPGVGSAVIDWLAYAFGILWRKDKSEFGKGSLDGLLFAESAQNSKEGGQAIPTLALGIPGGSGWIMILAAMLMYGISPGPPMVAEHAHITMLIVFTLALGNLLATTIGLFASAPLLRLTTVPYPAISAVIIPLVVLAAYLDMRSWFAIPILVVFSAIGLVMKYFGWPRPPLVLGFILGPIIDVNIQTAISLYGVVGVLTRPLTLILLGLLVLTAILFTRFLSRAETSAPAGPERAPSGSPAPEARDRRRSVRASVWKAWPPLLLMIGAAAALTVAMEYPPRARMLPVSLSAAIIVLSALELARQILRPETGPRQIMDLGMRSRGMEGAARAGWIMAGLFGLFFLLAMTIRLDNAAVAFAALLPVLFLSGWKRWLTGALTGGILALWTQGLMNHFMAVIWPEPVLAGWFLGAIGF
jgi:putative tricarboxylic transport membrane protein